MVKVRIMYALGITSLFPNLKDPDSKNGYEHFYDHQSGSGYLAFRLKTVQRNSPNDMKKSKTSVLKGPKTLRRISSTVMQLSGDECKEAVFLMRHSSDKKIVKEKMMATFQHRQKVVQDPAIASKVLDMFPRFLDTPGLITQDFNLLFGEEVSGKFLAKWPTFFMPRIISDCKNLPESPHVTDLLLSAQKTGGVWDSEVAGLLLFLHLLPPTSKGRKTSKMSTVDAVSRLVKFVKVETFLKETGPVQPFLLCIGEKKNSLQNFYGVCAFDELFKAHFAFAVSYDEALINFYTFIQTTLYGIDAGSMKESPRVKEIRARLLNTEL